MRAHASPQGVGISSCKSTQDSGGSPNQNGSVRKHPESYATVLDP